MIGDVLAPTHLIFILIVALLVLGPKRLPEVGRSLGRGIRDFRNALTGPDEPESPSIEEPRPAAAVPPDPVHVEEPAVDLTSVEEPPVRAGEGGAELPVDLPAPHEASLPVGSSRMSPGAE